MAASILTLDGLEELAVGLWGELAPGSVVWLSGELGSGKTTFVQAVARAALADPARSPTFALVHEYRSPSGPVVHVDCYRLRSPEEAVDLDFDGLLRRARLLMIEWPERAEGLVPRPTAHLRFTHTADRHERRVERMG